MKCQLKIFLLGLVLGSLLYLQLSADSFLPDPLTMTTEEILTELENSLTAREAAINQMEQRLTERENELQKTERRQNERETDLNEREQRVRQRESALNEIETLSLNLIKEADGIKKAEYRKGFFQGSLIGLSVGVCFGLSGGIYIGIKINILE